LYEQIAANKRKTFLLIFGFVLLLTLVGLAFNYLLSGGVVGIVIVAVIVIVSSTVSYFNSDKAALAISHAKPADPHQYARLYNLIEGLCIASGLPKPRLYIIEDDAPNAFSTGRNPKHAAVAVTTGLLAKMNRVELEGVLAHELSHVRNRDVRLMTLVAVLVGVVALLSDFLLRISFFGGGRRSGGSAGAIAFALGLAALVIAPIAAVLIQLAVSRRREYLADASAAEITGDGEGLALALRKLEIDQTSTAHASRAVAHLYIENPQNQATGVSTAFRGMFDTHPPLEARIHALEEAGGFRLAPA